MNQQKPKTRSTMVMVLVCHLLIIAIGLYFYAKSHMWQILVVLIIPLLISVFVVYAYWKEQKSDGQADEKLQEYVNGDYFSTPQWRERYLQYKQEHPFQSPKLRGMKADLHRRFITKDAIGFILLGCVFLVVSFLPFPLRINYRIISIIAGLFSIFVGTYFMSGQHIRHFFNRTDLDFEQLEASYRNGSMLTYQKNGINLGISHVIAYTAQEIFCIENANIASMMREVVRLKKYQDGVYAGETYLHRLYLEAKQPNSPEPLNVRIELHEFQVEMVLEEFARMNHGVCSNPIRITEEMDNQITVGSFTGE